MIQLMHCLSALLKTCFINSLTGIGIASIIICLLLKRLRDDSRIGIYAGATMSILVKMTVRFLILRKWRKWKSFQFMKLSRQGGLICIHKMTQEMSQISSLYVPVISSVWLIDVTKNIYLVNRHQPFTRIKWLEEKVVKKGFKRFTRTIFVLYYMASRLKKEERSGPCLYDRVYPLALQFANKQPVKKYIPNLEL